MKSVDSCGSGDRNGCGHLSAQPSDLLRPETPEVRWEVVTIPPNPVPSSALASPFMDVDDALLVVSLAIGVLVASAPATYAGVGSDGGRRRVRAADGHKSVGNSQ